MPRPSPPLAELFGRALRHAPASGGGDDTDERILDAAIDVLERHGTERASMDVVAERAGVGRATVFRRFKSKENLFTAALARDLRRMLDGLATRFVGVDDPVELVTESLAVVHSIGQHPLWRGADAPHRAELLDLLLREHGLGVAAHRAVTANLARAQTRGLLPAGDPPVQADVLLRIALSYLAVPSLTHDLADPDDVRRLARTALVPVMRSGKPEQT